MPLASYTPPSDYLPAGLSAFLQPDLATGGLGPGGIVLPRDALFRALGLAMRKGTDPLLEEVLRQQLGTESKAEMAKLNTLLREFFAKDRVKGYYDALRQKISRGELPLQ